MKGAIFYEDSPCSIYKQKCFLHLIQQPKYGMAMPCKADYSPAKSFYDVKNLSGLIYINR